MGGWTPISPWRLGAAQRVAVSGTSASSTAVNAQTRAVLLTSTTDCHVRIVQAGAAVVTDTLIKAGFPPLIFACGPVDVVSVIQDTASGFLYVTELSH